MVTILRDRVVYDNRILRLIAMRHGKETTPSLNLMIVCILIDTINCLYIMGQSDILYLNFSAYRNASREGEGKEKREKRLPRHPESESLQEVVVVQTDIDVLTM